MGESTCLVHSLPFVSESNNNGNCVHDLGDSVSFGRFTSESLAWEKWSAFPHKRYVEEAKSYAQPGSVAQKKAFFEAHYKKIAAQKAEAAAAAAALLEQEKAKSQVEERVCVTNHGAHDSEATVLLKPRDILMEISNLHASQKMALHSKQQPAVLNLKISVDEEQHIASNAVDAAGHTSCINIVEPETEKIEIAADLKNQELFNNKENFEDQISVSEDSRSSQMERPLLKSKMSTEQEVLQPKMRRKPATSSFRSSSNGKKQSRIPPSPAKYVSSMHPKKENMFTPRTKNPIAMESTDKKKLAPRSLYTLMNSGSVKESAILNSAVGKSETTKPAPSAHATPKRSATPTFTPSKVTNGVNKQPFATSSVKNRMETPVHPSALGNKTPGQKWQIFSAVSKSLSAYRNKLQSPTVSSPFTLRTDERAARRKQKLEEKFNEKEAQKVHLQTTLMEKAETEFKRLRQSFCFRARPLPSFYNERETPKSPIKKTPQANPKPITPARKPLSTISQPSSSVKRSSRRLWKTNDQNPTKHPLASLATSRGVHGLIINRKNRKPNRSETDLNQTEQKFGSRFGF